MMPRIRFGCCLLGGVVLVLGATAALGALGRAGVLEDLSDKAGGWLCPSMDDPEAAEEEAVAVASD